MAFLTVSIFAIVVLASIRVHPAISVLLLLIERIRNLLASIQRTDEDEQRASGDNQTEGARGFVTFVI